MKTEIKILIVEHDPQDVEMLEFELKKGGIKYVSKTVFQEQDYCSALKEFLPDIILSDYSFPTFDGLTAFSLRDLIAPGTPFIFVTGAVGEETSIELIKKGVTDFVLKDKLFTLCLKINRALIEATEKQGRNRMEEDLIRSEKRLARAQQVAHMGSWEFYFATDDILWSDETLRIYGLLPGHNRQSFIAALALIHPEDVGAALIKMKRSRIALCDFSIHFRIIRIDGLIRYIYLDCKIEFDSKDKASGFHGIVHDVTETVLLEAQLVEERSEKQSEITEAVMTAQENERAYIGRELHENINQILAVANIYIRMADTYAEDRTTYLDKSYIMIRNVMEEIRKISKTLVVPAVNFVGLCGSIRNLLYDLNLINAVTIEFHQDGITEEFLNERLQLTIFRIVQEQMTNILKHAGATKANISLSRSENLVTLLISDNGDGCDMAIAKNGVGIINIKSRAQAYRGKVSILSMPGKGYELKVELPLQPEGTAA